MEKKLQDIYIQIGINIKNKRKEKGLTQKQLALKAIPKLDRAKISDIENGKEDFAFSTLIRICVVLDINVKDIL